MQMTATHKAVLPISGFLFLAIPSISNFRSVLVQAAAGASEPILVVDVVAMHRKTLRCQTKLEIEALMEVLFFF